MPLLRLAWRNLWRHPRRTGLTAAAIAFAAFLLVFMITLQLGSYDMMTESSLRVFPGHFQVQRPGYQDMPRMRDTLDAPRLLAERLRQVPGVRGASARAYAFALVSSQERSYGAQIAGVEADHEGAVSSIPGRIVAGRYLAGDQAREAVIGAALARNLQVAVGSEITVLGSGRDGSFAAEVLTVAGLFESGMPEMDRGLIEIPLGAFQEIFSMGDTAHAVIGTVNDLGQLAEVLARIEISGPLALLDWNALMPGLKQLIEADMAGSWVMYACLIVIVVFSIFNTFLMAVLERTREFGMMLALGMRPTRLGGLIMLESALLTALGLTVGTALGLSLSLYYHYTGFSYPGMAEVGKEFGLIGEIYPRLSLSAILAGPLFVLVSTLCAALWPALRVRRLRPVEAMKAG